jgi:hypothetical protein
MAITKDWVGNKKSTFVTLGASSHSSTPRQEHDYYATDPRAIDALLQVTELPTQVWESACGGGHLSKRLEELGYEVVSTDLYDRGYGQSGIDFFKSELLAPCIVTNPPYKYAHEFVEHALGLGVDKLAMFLKITFLEGQKRKKLFEVYPPKTVAVFSKRIQVAINGDPEMFTKSSAACYAWFIWEKNFNGRPEILWL